MISPLALPPQRLALESDAPAISELMRVSALELFRGATTAARPPALRCTSLIST